MGTPKSREWGSELISSTSTISLGGHPGHELTGGFRVPIPLLAGWATLSSGLTGLRALLIGRDIGIDEFLLHLLRPLLEKLHQLLEPVIDDGTVLAGRGGCPVLATGNTTQR